ncbi:hypothetical protein SARC_01531 [Sphaeroforma arctica JP610]|uniref:HIT domain-containing protein n=1 Tax=Sphaeroforma arctica JP610 TaxID=667725 RepID=A0A0L0GBB2_9EUKA|nr:hypothetical protein SARC_01531 [Sphaeroforma arctica JP610]KNC86307.1 hypothetical protein SARC_01531 [Sphaeroforma arctica JP610]|eukprot:XP_014160209.1 hypothetical protein SARC_01531 [Sphaeroforma arctica JP610]
MEHIAMLSHKVIASIASRPAQIYLRQCQFVHSYIQARNMSNEVDKAQTAKPQGDTIFGKILRNEIPSVAVWSDDTCYAFRDKFPTAPQHIVLIPRKPITQLSNAKDEDEPLLGHLLNVARKIAKQEKLTDGFRIVINDGKHGAQSVYHLHIHIIGGRQLDWPPG